MASIAILGVPVDLGAARRGVEMGPSAVRLARLADRLRRLGHTVIDTGDVAVPTRETLGVADGLAFLPTITAICRETADRTAALVRAGHIPLVLGGDHSLSAGSVAGVATALAERGERLGLIWLDAHADINTPGSTLSGNIHGMPVAHLIGHGDRGLASLATPSPAVHEWNVAIIGARDLDPAERTHVREFGVNIYTMRDIDERGMRAVLADAIAKVSVGTAGIHVSLDLDFVDPREAPGVGTPVHGGATFREAHLAMETLWDTGRLVGMDLVEVNPVLDRVNHTTPPSWRSASWRAASDSGFSRLDQDSPTPPIRRFRLKPALGWTTPAVETTISRPSVPLERRSIGDPGPPPRNSCRCRPRGGRSRCLAGVGTGFGLLLDGKAVCHDLAHADQAAA
jgi:arginase